MSLEASADAEAAVSVGGGRGRLGLGRWCVGDVGRTVGISRFVPVLPYPAWEFTGIRRPCGYCPHGNVGNPRFVKIALETADGRNLRNRKSSMNSHETTGHYDQIAHARKISHTGPAPPPSDNIQACVAPPSMIDLRRTRCSPKAEPYDDHHAVLIHPAYTPDSLIVRVFDTGCRKAGT